MTRRSVGGFGWLYRAVGMAALVVGALFVLSSCMSMEKDLSTSGEALSQEQSEALATARFRLGAGGPFAVTVSAGNVDAVDHYSARLTVDPASQRAWGTVSRGPEGLAITEEVAYSTTVYATARDDGWSAAPVEVIPGPGMLVPLSLAADRPENAQLVRQADNRYLGRARHDGVEMSVFRLATSTGDAARTRLWLDDEGALRRLDAGDDTRLVVNVGTGKPKPQPGDLDAILGTG